MNFIIKEFAILSPVDKKAFYTRFSEKTNLVVGKKDTGKSSIARAMLYTLGCDIKNFELKDILPFNIYILHFSIGSEDYVLLRKKLKSGKGRNYFKVYKNQQFDGVFYSTKDFARYLNNIMNISLVTIDNENKETKLFPNHIFLPFFTDQDNSWQNYLSATFSGLGFIKQYKKLILEYFIGIRTNEYYDLKLKQAKLDNQIQIKKALIESKQLIFKENSRNIKIIENIDVEDFKRQYNTVIEVYKNIINTEHELKRRVNEKLYLRNTYLESMEMLTSNINDFVDAEITKECPNCHQRLERDFSEDYKLYSTREMLINERELIEMQLKICEEKLDEEMASLKKLTKEDADYKNKLNSDGAILNLAERADSYALSRINLTLEKDISSLKSDLINLQEEKKSVDNKLRKIKDKDLSSRYKELMKEYFDKLSIPFKLNSLYDNNFESVKISQSGTTKNQAFIVQYLTIYKLIQENKSVVKIPMIIDSYIKDHFTELDTEKTTKFIFEILNDVSHQSFVFITDNKQTLSYIDKEKVHILELGEANNLLSNNYEKVYRMYAQYIEGDLD